MLSQRLAATTAAGQSNRTFSWNRRDRYASLQPPGSSAGARFSEALSQAQNIKNKKKVIGICLFPALQGPNIRARGPRHMPSSFSPCASSPAGSRVFDGPIKYNFSAPYLVIKLQILHKIRDGKKVL